MREGKIRMPCTASMHINVLLRTVTFRFVRTSFLWTGSAILKSLGAFLGKKTGVCLANA